MLPPDFIAKALRTGCAALGEEVCPWEKLL